MTEYGFMVLPQEERRAANSRGGSAKNPKKGYGSNRMRAAECGMIGDPIRKRLGVLKSMEIARAARRAKREAARNAALSGDTRPEQG